MSVISERNLLKEKSIHIVNGRCSDCIGVMNGETGTPRQYSWDDCYCKKNFSCYTKDGELSNCSLKMVKKDFQTPINLNINEEIRIYRSTFAKDSYLMLDQYEEGKVIDIYPVHRIESMKTKSIEFIVEKEVRGDLVYYFTKEKLLKEINSLERYSKVYCTKECLDAEISKTYPHIQVFYPAFYEQRRNHWISKGLNMEGNHIVLLEDEYKKDQLELIV